MIRHIVLVRFRDGTPPAEIAAILADLDALRTVVPGMLSFASGANVSPEGMARGYTHAFSADFESAAARDGYLAHPAPQKAGARLVASAHEGAAGLVVVDFEV